MPKIVLCSQFLFALTRYFVLNLHHNPKTIYFILLTMLTETDLKQMEAKGITVERLNAQLNRFSTGFPYLSIIGAATPENGIKVLTPEQEQMAIDRWSEYLRDGGEVYKFVPASGAASRMFKAMYEFADGDEMKAPEGSPARAIVDNIDNLPFKAELEQAVKKMYDTELPALVAAGRDRDIIKAIIDPEGMNYGNLPKGLLSFHSYEDGARTPVDEHLTEGAQTAANSTGIVNLHFTVSASHKNLFEDKLAKSIPAAEARTGKKFNISMSEQKPSTDTVAANPDGTPFRQEDGSLLFRPGGHGALIENLNDIDSTVIFIKNIDNVVPDSLRDSTVRYKSVIAGYLIQLHDKIARYLEALDDSDVDDTTVDAAIEFVEKQLCITDGKLSSMSKNGKAEWLKAKLDRPLRVCGMVRNEGEPGGGPFIAVNPDGSSSPQILESHQIDMSRPEYAAMLRNATHFNPVDLVCYVRRSDGTKYDLRGYTDPATGFISSKSAHGRELRALELPGLWNGAMSDWNTVFVEVPASTFNPVKTVNDLLRPAHQS